MSPSPNSAPFPTERESNFVTKGQVLFASALSLAFSLLYFLPYFPFSRGLCAVAAFAALFHFALFLLFERIKPPFWTVANMVDFAILGFGLHYSGGILSPFNVFLIIIFISGAGYGINDKLAMAAGVAVYLAVVGGEYFGLLDPVRVTPQDVYASSALTAIISIDMIGHMLLGGNIYRVTVRRLWRTLEAEHAEKTGMLRRLADLDAPSQVGLLVARINHEVRGSLSALDSFVHALAKTEKLSGQAERDCETMASEIQRISVLLGKLQQYAKPGRVTMAELDLAEVLENILAIVRFLPQAETVKFIKKLPRAKALRVMASKEQLQQVCFNLLKNALEALGPSRRRIEVEVAASDGSALVCVRDEGRGIPPDVLERLSSGSFTTKPQGSGLGLLIAREIVQAHGGDLSLASKPGRGTTVSIRLPLTRRQPSQAREVEEKA